MSAFLLAQLKFGIPLIVRGTEPLNYLQDDESDNKFIARIHGEFQEPTIPYEGNEKVYERSWQKIRRINESSGIEIIHHRLSNDESIPILVIADVGFISTSGDNPTTNISLETKPIWRWKLKDFCKKAGFRFKEPKWILSVTKS